MEEIQIRIDYVDDDNPYPGVEVDWTKEPTFEFGTEVAGLMALQELGYELRSAREQVRHVMRYLTAAVLAARNNGEGKTSKEAIIGHSGLARQTVYDILDGR